MTPNDVTRENAESSVQGPLAEDPGIAEIDRAFAEKFGEAKSTAFADAGSVHHHHHHHRSSGSGRRHRRHHHHHHHKKLTAGRVIFRIFLVLALFMAAIAGAFYAVSRFGQKEMKKSEVRAEAEAPVPEIPDVPVAAEEDGTVTYNGEHYRYNEDLINILIMGVDRKGSLEDTEAVAGKSSGQADVLFIASVNTKTGAVSLLHISRDTITDVDVLDVEGNYTGTEKMQICLAYSTGDGGPLSCGNTVRAVSRMFYGLPIHAYAAMDLDAIEPINESVDGVTVKVLQDMTDRDPAFVEGAEVTLHGNQAMKYVRARYYKNESEEVIRESNNKRMERQRQYLTAFLKKATARTKRDLTYPLTLYRVISPFMVTDITPSRLTYLVSLALGGANWNGKITKIPGESVRGEKHNEFYVTISEFYPLILDTFYDKL